MKQYYLAVDGGGTKTDYVLTDCHGAVVDCTQGSGTNHENFPDGYDGATAQLSVAIDNLLARNGLGIESIGDAVLGLAGIDHEYQKQEMEQRLQAIGLDRLLICNDGFLPVKGETRRGVGIAYNCGTGVCCDAINDSGEMLQLGGLDRYSNDFGGGSVIVQKVYSSIYDDVMMGIQKTVMSELYYRTFGISSCQEFYDSIRMLQENTGEHRKQTIQILFAAMEAQDPVAMEVCAGMACRGAQFVGAAYRKLGFGNGVEVVLTGSMHTKPVSRRYVELLCHELAKQLPEQTRYIVAENKPVQGAVRWLQERNGL